MTTPAIQIESSYEGRYNSASFSASLPILLLKDMLKDEVVIQHEVLFNSVMNNETEMDAYEFLETLGLHDLDREIFFGELEGKYSECYSDEVELYLERTPSPLDDDQNLLSAVIEDFIIENEDLMKSDEELAPLRKKYEVESKWDLIPTIIRETSKLLEKDLQNRKLYLSIEFNSSEQKELFLSKFKEFAKQEAEKAIIIVS